MNLTVFVFFQREFRELNDNRLFATPWTAACQALLSITNSQSLLKLMFIELVMPSNHLILSRPLLLLPSIFPSIRVFSNESALRIRWPKYWSFIFSISPSKEYSDLISFRINWLDLLAVWGTLQSLLQHHSSKASIRGPSASFMVQLSHPYMTTGKTRDSHNTTLFPHHQPIRELMIKHQHLGPTLRGSHLAGPGWALGIYKVISPDSETLE